MLCIRFSALVEHHGCSGFEDLVGDLHLADPEAFGDLGPQPGTGVVERRQAVHEFHLWPAGGPHHRRIHPVGRKQRDAVLPQAALLPHRQPDIGIDEVGPRQAGIDRRVDHQPRAGALRHVAQPPEEIGIRMAGLRAAQPHVHTHLHRTECQGAGYVVGRIADEGHGKVGQAAARDLLHGHEVGKNLGGMRGVGQAVIDRDAGKARQFLGGCVAGAAELDRVVHPAKHPGSVADRFLVTDLAAAGPQIGDMRALVVGGNLEAGPGARRILLEHQGNVAPPQALRLGPGIFRRLQVRRQPQQETDLVRGDVGQGQKAAVAQVGRHSALLLLSGRARRTLFRQRLSPE